jgi:hypothetical protein
MPLPNRVTDRLQKRGGRFGRIAEDHTSRKLDSMSKQELLSRFLDIVIEAPIATGLSLSLGVLTLQTVKDLSGNAVGMRSIFKTDTVVLVMLRHFG